MPKNQKGKGWFGDSEGHAKAGRKGGIARGKRNREKSSSANLNQSTNF